MAYLLPALKNAGDILAAADINKLRDSTSYLATDRPVCQLHMSAAVAFVSGAEQTITWTQVDTNVGALYSGTFPQQITIPFAGWWTVGVNWTWTGASGAGTRRLTRAYNGSNAFMADDRPASVNSACTMERTVFFAASSVLKVNVYHDVGAVLNGGGAGFNESTFFAMFAGY